MKPQFRKIAADEDLIEVISRPLETNHRASFCQRDLEVMDTIIFHHSETPTGTSVEDINEYHMNQGTVDDPWYMIGYHYAITSPYSTGVTKRAVYSARPIHLSGAHVGGTTYSKNGDEETKRLLKERPVMCGKENEEKIPATDTFNEIGEYKVNATSVAVVIIGNYAPYSHYNRGGFTRSNPRKPSTKLIDMSARLACDLQRKYPRLKTIKWHSYYKATSCPGVIKDNIKKIVEKAKDYQCEFNY
jgi:hypothetical protein